MSVLTAPLTKHSFDTPDEVRPFAARGHLDVVDMAGHAIGRAVFDPGWRWSNDVKPIAGTESCMAPHAGYVLSGRMRVEMDSGEAMEFGPGDLMTCPPGHDAWTLGDEPCVVLDWVGFAEYAKPR